MAGERGTQERLEQRRLPHRRGYRSLSSVLIVGLLLILPISSHSLPAQAGGTPPFTGTSELTYVSQGLAPKSVARTIGRHRVVSKWVVADPSHFRLDSQTLEPVLKSQDETLVANGTSLIWYKSIFNRASKMALGPHLTLGTLGLFQGGSLVGMVEGMGRSYFSYLEKRGGHVRLLHQEVMVGRSADVFEIRTPYGTSSTSGTGTGQKVVKHEYETARLWIDHQYQIVLRLEDYGMSGSNSDPRHWVYQVTSLTFGQGPSPTALAFQAPVKPKKPPSSSQTVDHGSRLGANARWHVPKGFIRVGTPVGYTLSGAGAEDEPMWGSFTAIEALFTGTTGFLYAQEQVRIGGLPATLMSGTPLQAGHCPVWTGRYSGSRLHWLALQRGKVSLLIVSNNLSQSALIRYAARRICR